MNDFRKGIGVRIKEKRKSLNYTQEEISEKLGISIKHYGNVERGLAGLSLENLVQLANILGTDMNYLIGTGLSEDATVPEIWQELYLNCPETKRSDLISAVESILNICET